MEYNDFLSVKYDEVTRGEFKWLAPHLLEKHIKPYLKPKINVLDIGVGTGQTSEIFVNSDTNVSCIDISGDMLSVAKSKYPYKELIQYDVEDGLLKLFPEEKFDIIVAVGILEFIKDIKKTLSELKQLLKNNGVIAFTYEIFKPDNKYGIEKESPLGAGSQNIPELLSFMVYRRLSSEVDLIIKELGLTIKSRKVFTGYLRSQLKIPVPYEILVVS